MKKLMTMLAAVATAFGLYATDYGTSFEAQTAGTSIFEDQTESANWSQGTVAPDKALVTTYASAGITPIEGNQRPDQFKSAGVANFLDVKTTLGNPIARTLDAPWDLSTSGNFYSDTLVRFTYFDSDPENIGSDAKIAVWAKEVEENNVIVGTNLMVTALGADGDPANFCVYENWEPTLADGWSRVTIKAIPSVLKTGADKPGFVVWIDGNPVGCAEAKAVTADLTLSDIAAAYNENGQLFLSMVQSGGAKTTISAVAFDGQGQIDDVSLTSVAPAFAADPQFFYLDGDANVVSLQVNTTLNFEKKDLPVALPWDDKDTSYDVVATYANGYVDGTWTITAGEVANGTFTPGVGGATGTVVAQAALVKIGNKSYATLADALADTAALSAAGGKVDIAAHLTLTSALSVNVTVGEPAEAISVILDLAGNTITYADTETFAITAVTPLTITDSKTGGTIAAAKAVTSSGSLTIESGIFGGDVNITAGAGAITGGTFNGAFTSATAGVLTGGNFKNAFQTEDYFATGYTATKKGDYWVVELATYTITFKENDESPVVDVDPIAYQLGGDVTLPTPTKTGYTFVQWETADEVGVPFVYKKGETVGSFALYAQWTVKTYELTFPKVDYAKAVVSNDTTEVEVTKLDAIEYNTAVTVYWTADAGYKITEGATEKITMTGDKQAKAPKVEADGPALPGPIQGGSDEQKQGYNTWATGKGAGVTGTDAELVDAFILDLTPAVIEAAGSIEKAASVKLGAEIDSDMLAALVAGGTVDFTELNKKYPYATFKFVEAEELNPEEGVSNFWRLTAKFVSANSAN